MRLVVIDGYNVLFGSDRYKPQANRDLAAAREILIGEAAEWRKDDDDVYIVFDAVSNPGSTGVVQEVLGISVVYSSFGEEADAMVERIVSKSREPDRDIVVVTSDLQTQRVTSGARVSSMSAEEFGRQIDSYKADKLVDQYPRNTASRIEDRIEPEVKILLERLSGRNKTTD